MNVKPCHDCGCLPGEFHKPGCDWEVCPFCGHQLIGCDCRDEILSDEIDKLWDAKLREKGLIAYDSKEERVRKESNMLPANTFIQFRQTKGENQ